MCRRFLLRSAPRKFVSSPSVLSSPIPLQQHRRSPSSSMHAFNLPHQPFALTTEVRGDRPDSYSDSEGSHHALLHYGDHPQKSDIETEGVADFQPVGDTLTIITPLGADAALTSQTLKADGTPKCPMNAFMIFARLRRSQPSAANHSMRTGECKIGLMHGQLHHMKGSPRMETLQMTDSSTLMANYSEHVRILHLLVCLRPHIVP